MKKFILLFVALLVSCGPPEEYNCVEESPQYLRCKNGILYFDPFGNKKVYLECKVVVDSKENRARNGCTKWRDPIKWVNQRCRVTADKKLIILSDKKSIKLDKGFNKSKPKLKPIIKRQTMSGKVDEIKDTTNKLLDAKNAQENIQRKVLKKDYRRAQIKKYKDL